MPAKTLMGIREFAQSAHILARYGRKVAPSTITRMAQDGKLILENGKIHVEASLARMDELGVGKLRRDVAERHATESAHKNGQDRAHAAQSAQGIPQAIPSEENATAREFSATGSATEDASDLGAIQATGGKAKYKAAALHFENQQIKLGMAIARAIRLVRQDVRDEAAGLGDSLRAACERLVDQTAPRLAIQARPQDRGLLIRREVQKIKRLIDLEATQGLRRLKRNARKGKAE